ncbi:MAG: NCS1 family nucleobase:cation symporter-1 [Planctomycetia bacterium]
MSTPTASPDPRLWNEDLAPVPPEKRTWTWWNVAALWIGMAVCITTYTLASSLIQQGMNWWQATLTIFLGNLIVLVPMTLNAHPGTRYGIPFPVLLRAPFGVYGANVPALMRGLVACGWFGIQTWVGGAAIHATAAVILGFDPAAGRPLPLLGITAGELLCFLAFWAMNVWFIVRGMDSIKWLEALSAPFLLVVGAALVGWAWQAADGFGPIFRQPARLATHAEFWPVFGSGLTAMIGYWATLSLNIPDFSRFARSQRDQVIGQAVGLPTTMTFYSFIGIVVTSATVVIFGEAIWDPVQVISRFGNPWLSALALVTLAVATLSTNIAANVVSPANDFAALAPRLVSFRTGGLITAALGVVMMPWKLYQDPSGYVFTWLIGYSALLGPIAGIMIADYFLWRRCRLVVDDLYRSTGEYRSTGGFSLVGFASLALAVLPNIPGFLVRIGAVPADVFPGWLVAGYHYAWFIGFALGLILYTVLRNAFPHR